MRRILLFHSWGAVSMIMTVLVIAQIKNPSTYHVLGINDNDGYDDPKYDDDNDIVPTPAIAGSSRYLQETFQPTVTRRPTITKRPTYTENCNLCGIPGHVVTRPDREFTFLNVVVTCGELEKNAAQGILPPDLCSSAQSTADTFGCNCQAKTDSNGASSPVQQPQTAAPVAAPIPAPVSAPKPVPVPVPVPVNVPVSVPVAVSAPVGLLPTPLPTYTEKCYVCGDPSRAVTSHQTSITFSNGQTYTCGQIQSAALAGVISPTLCPTIISEIETSTLCNCQSLVAPGSASAPSLPKTFKPTVSKQPTVSPKPTYSDPCYACGSETKTVVNRKRIATYFDFYYTCGELYDVQRNILASDASCPTYVYTVQSQCGCKDMIDSPAPSATPTVSEKPVIPETWSPTVSAIPTVTNSPTYTELCYVCGTNDKKVSTPDATVGIFGKLETCGKIEQGGINGFIPPNKCSAIIAAVKKSCACIPGTAEKDIERSASIRQQKYSSVLVTTCSFLLLWSIVLQYYIAI